MANILFIDDEELVLNSLRRELRKFPHQLYFANSFNQAKGILDNKVINVIVTDMKMPGVNGLEVLRYIKENHPYIVKIVLSGFAQITQIIATVNQGDVFRYIKKPWVNNDQLINALTDAIEYAAYLQSKDDHTNNLEKRNQFYQKILSKFNVTKERLELEIDFIKQFYSFYIKTISKPDTDHKAIMVLKENIMECFPLTYEKLNCAAIDQKIISTIETEYGESIEAKENYDNTLNIDVPIDLLNTIIGYFISQVIRFIDVDSIELETKLNNTETNKFIGLIINIITKAPLSSGVNKSYFDEIFELFSPYAKIRCVTKDGRKMLVVKYNFTLY